MKLNDLELTSVRILIASMLFIFCPPAQADEPLIYCRPNNMVSANAYIAEANGYFAEEGLNIRFESATNAKICLDALLAGRVDVLTGAESAFVYVTPHKSDFRIIAFAQTNPETALFHRKDRVATPQDLKGKRIGYLPGSCSVPFLSLMLEKHGVAWNDVKLTPLQPPALTQALIGNAVDAISIWEPWGANAMAAMGDQAAVFRDPKLYSYQAVLVTRQSTITERPSDLRKLLKALLRAETFLTGRPDEAIDILSKAIFLDRKVLSALWPDFTFRIHLSGADLHLLRQDFEILKKHDTNFSRTAVPDFESYIDRAPLREVAADRVQQ